MSEEADVLYVPDLARRLGTTETAVRHALANRSGAVPRGAFKLGRRWAWRAADVERFLAEKAGSDGSA